MLESEVERQVTAYAKSHDCLTYKLNGQGERGKPDRLILRNGKSLFLELKRPGKQPTLLQWHHIRKLRAQGFNAEWANTVPTALKHINQHLL
jgi:hypothetical protein